MNAAVINKNAKLQRVPEACADTNWSRNTLMKVAAEANAIIRVGRTVRIDMSYTEWQGAPHSTTRKKTALCSETVKNSITI